MAREQCLSNLTNNMILSDNLDTFMKKQREKIGLDWTVTVEINKVIKPLQFSGVNVNVVIKICLHTRTAMSKTTKVLIPSFYIKVFSRRCRLKDIQL